MHLLFALFLQDEFAARWSESTARAAEFLVKAQGDDGLWSREFQGRRWPSLALSALALDALVRMPAALREKHKDAIARSVEALAKRQSAEDGGWAEPPGQLRAYVTSIAIMALQAHDAAANRERIARGRKFLAELQVKEGFWAGGYEELEYEMVEGKMQPKRLKTGNLSSVEVAAQAMRETGYDDSEYWKRIADFAGKCQNSPETNTDPEWVKALESRGFKMGGGFVYKPDLDTVENYGGYTVDSGDGKKVLNGYGSMSYAGLKTYLFAGLRKDDPRVLAAVRWLRENYTLERHPGFPFESDRPAGERKDRQGLFYYYLAMARALDAWGENPFETGDGVRHDWPREMARQLISLQRGSGAWFNDQPRWWEGDELLVTAYALKVYSILARHLASDR